jgi:hypothetical protein
MNRRFLSHRTVAIGIFGLAVALAVPVIARSVAGADPSEAVPPVQPQHTPAEPAQAQPAQAQPAKAQAARSIVYGTATETIVTVYRQSLPQGTPEVLFSYENLDDPGYPEQGLEDPELTLSPDGRSVAYFSRSGLRVRHLDTGADKVVIGRSEPPPGGDGYDAPIWTLEELNAPADEDPKDYYTAGMFSLHDIAFSPDGRFLSFAGNWYEYSDHWVIELATGRHWQDKGSADLAWSPSSDRVAVAGPWYADPGELAVSSPGDFGRYNTIRPVPHLKVDLGYEDVEFAPVGNRIAFAVSDRSWPSPDVELGTSNVDGTGFTKVNTTGATEAFAFAGNGDAIYSVERRSGHLMLVAHDLASGHARDVATVPANFAEIVDFWVTPSGELAVVAATPDVGHGVFQERLLLFAPDGRLLEKSPFFSHATRFIGIG